MISKMKVIGTIKKAGLPYASGSRSTGFSARSWGGDSTEVEVEYSGKDTVKAWDDMVQAILAVDSSTVIRYTISDYGDVHVYFNPKWEPGEVWDALHFAAELQVFVDKWAVEAEEQKKVKAEREAKADARHAARIAMAESLNPDVMDKVIMIEGEQTSDTGVGFVTLHGNRGNKNLYILFSWKKEDAWFTRQGEKVYRMNLSISSSLDDRGGRENGSTSVNDCKSLKECLLEYLCSWSIYGSLDEA
jgi:hypothetical protein